MKILFDANTPAPLARFLRGQYVTRAAEEAGFELLSSCDQNVPHLENLASQRLAVIILSSNHRPTLRQVAAKIATAVDFVQTAQVLRIDVTKLQRPPG